MAEDNKRWHRIDGLILRADNPVRANILKPFRGEDFDSEEYEGNIHKEINRQIKNKNRGVYILTRELTEDENKIIESILNLKPQKGIVIPKII